MKDINEKSTSCYEQIISCIEWNHTSAKQGVII